MRLDRGVVWNNRFSVFYYGGGPCACRHLLMQELNSFFNDGFGWKCRHCFQAGSQNLGERSRLMTEGEAESNSPGLSNIALAKWADPAERILLCPLCGVTEPADPA